LTSLYGKFNGKDRVDDASLLHIAVSVLVCNTFILDVSPSYPRHDHHLIHVFVSFAELYLHDNGLTGPIPTELGSLTSLERKFNGKDCVDDASLFCIAVSIIVTLSFLLFLLTHTTTTI
jgi:hypothetical protein